MSIQILNLHKHEISISTLSGLENDLNFKYEINGWSSLKKLESIKLQKNCHIYLHCYTCGYKYSSGHSIKALTIDAPHNLFFKEDCKKKPYSKENNEIKIDDRYYKTEYFSLNKDYNDIMLAGNEKEKIEYLFSEMEKYKNAYAKERENNKTINKVNEQKENKILELKREIKKLKLEINKLIKEKNIFDGKSEYDAVLSVDSIKNLATNGWEIKYKKEKGKEKYDSQYKNAQTLVVGVVGNGNKGKSFLLKKLSDYNVPMGYNVKTEGLSIIYRKEESYNLTILDSAGQETPLLVEKNGNNKNEEFEEYSRDKLVTELYIQQFNLWKSNVVILLVGSITLSEQKLYARVKSELLTLKENQKKNKKLFVVHNLQNIYRKEDVDDYIVNVLKKLYNVELQETVMFTKKGNYDSNGFDKYFLEKDNNDIIHLILINDYCENSKYYNYNAIEFLKGTIIHETGRQTFPILENSKEFLLEISDQILEKKLSEDDIKIIQDKETDKLMVNKEIQLKRFVVDEMGITKNDDNTARYSYYVDPEKSKFIVNFELPGGGTINDPIVEPIQGYYSFIFEGEVNGELSPKYEDFENEQKEEKQYEEICKEKLDKITFSKNLRKKHPIHIEFKVSNQVIQLKYNEQNELKYSIENTKKGMIIYIFDVVLVKPPKREKRENKF